MKKIISVCLLITILYSVFMLSSCGPVFRRDPGFPRGYTGGLQKRDNSGFEIYWVETYDEYLRAMEGLRSHGSNFYNSVIFSYEGDLFDTKYCFWFEGDMDFVKYGDYPFDRYAEGVMVTSYAFFEDVTIDELVFSYVRNYDAWGISHTNYTTKTTLKEDVSIDDFVITNDDELPGYVAYYDNKEMFIFYKSIFMNDECLEVVMNSLEVVR